MERNPTIIINSSEQLLEKGTKRKGTQFIKERNFIFYSFFFCKREIKNRSSLIKLSLLLPGKNGTSTTIELDIRRSLNIF